MNRPSAPAMRICGQQAHVLRRRARVRCRARSPRTGRNASVPDLQEHLPGPRFDRATLQRQHQPQAKEVGGIQQRLGHLRPQLDRPLAAYPCPPAVPTRPATGETALDHRGDQVVLVGEVPVDRRRRQTALLADQRDGGALVAALGGDLGRRVQNSLTRLLAVRPGAPPAAGFGLRALAGLVFAAISCLLWVLTIYAVIAYYMDRYINNSRRRVPND